MTRRTHALAALAVLLAAATPRPARAAVLAVLTPEVRGQAAPTVEQRQALADAVAEVLSQSLPEVLTGSETRSRLELLDPVHLQCAEPGCAGGIARLLGARGVALVRPSLAGSMFRLEIAVVGSAGETLASEADEIVVADWQDALAFGRLLARRLLPRLTPPSRIEPASPTGSPAQLPDARPAPSPPVEVPRPARRAARLRERSAPRWGEVAIGGALFAAGGALVTVGAVVIASAAPCTRNDLCPPSMPGMPESVGPTPFAFLALGTGGVAVVTGTILVIDGLLARERRRGRHPAGLPISRFGLALEPRGTSFAFHGVF